MSAGPLPSRWLKCPRKSAELIGGKFLAFKTPLNDRFDDQVPPEYRFSPSMLFNSMRSYKVNIGLWIDLTNTRRFYRQSEVENFNCKYIKVQCRGHNESPSEEQVKLFVRICSNFIAQHPLDIIAVHCTHGFNRTGFLIASYLIEAMDWSPEAAWQEFRMKRAPGIYKQEYINDLFDRYGDVSDAPSAPELPDWCFEDNEVAQDDNVDDDGNPNHSIPRNPNRYHDKNKKVPVFMEGVPGVFAVTEQPLLGQVQRRFSELCGFRKKGFPGAQPVSMDRENIEFLRREPYKVSWKADGTRYMMLIDGPDAIFFTDRDHSIFKVEGMTFLTRRDENVHLKGTVLDGEMVIDEDPSSPTGKVPRYLVYDIVIIHKDGKDQAVGQVDFNTRLVCIEREIEKARRTYIESGRIDKFKEPFRVRMKQFWDIQSTKTLLGPNFQKEKLGHEPDGLIFQPINHPYQCGRDDKILKWKPCSHNSVDFKLQIQRENRPGMLAKSIGCLYVGGFPHQFAEIKLNQVLRELNHKIIECNWNYEKGCWEFMRERTDKSFPNGYNTAMGVWKSINEPVTEEMLLNIVNSVPQRGERHHHQGGSGQKRTHEMPPPPPPKFAKMA